MLRRSLFVRGGNNRKAFNLQINCCPKVLQNASRDRCTRCLTIRTGINMSHNKKKHLSEAQTVLSSFPMHRNPSTNANGGKKERKEVH